MAKFADGGGVPLDKYKRAAARVPLPLKFDDAAQVGSVISRPHLFFAGHAPASGDDFKALVQFWQKQELTQSSLSYFFGARSGPGVAVSCISPSYSSSSYVYLSHVGTGLEETSLGSVFARPFLQGMALAL